MTDKRQSRALASPLGSGSLRVVRKIQLSVQSEEGSGGEVKPLLQKSERLTVAREECSKCDLFPALLTNGDCEGGYLGNGRNRELEKCSIRGERKYREPSPSPERGHLERDGSGKEQSSPALVEEAEEEVAEEARLIRQFGKQGSGRSDLTLPSGVHATPQGQLFLVDCGNARVQVTDSYGNVMQQVNSPRSDYGGSSRRCRNYFDVAVNSKGLIALTCAAERALLVFNRHGRLLQTYGGGPIVGGASPDGLEAPRGVTVTQQQEFLVADLRRGTLTALKLDPKTGSRLERTVVTGFDRPYLVAACQHSGLVAVSERGSETGREPCVKVLDPGWTTLKVLGVCPGMGPVLSSPWGICIDHDGAVLVADWAERHRVVLFPAQGIGRVVVSDGLSSPRGLALLPSGSLVVSDSMHHCIKLYQYK
uniref:NHL repeat-containing protein n=1 Tax=Denticeps clupeoides TaxID=299321 RepID=A0AAY4D186_9TELE